MVKVHFAGSDNAPPRITALKAAGVNYRLFTCYGFINGKQLGDDFKVDGLIEGNNAFFEHSIMDSGLFTLMFGAKSGASQDEQTIRNWQEKIIAFVKANGINASIVECDCQKIISPEFAWELRREMRERLPDHEIINVFHLEDGRQGFEKLCEWSDYIAISVPELRLAQPKTYRQTVCALTRQARRISPNLKIHLLGCTENYLLERNRFCTSADSSSWLSPLRYGNVGKNHIRNIKPEVLRQRRELCREVSAKCKLPLTAKGLEDAAKATVCAEVSRRQYVKAAGNQD